MTFASVPLTEEFPLLLLTLWAVSLLESGLAVRKKDGCCVGGMGFFPSMLGPDCVTCSHVEVRYFFFPIVLI